MLAESESRPYLTPDTSFRDVSRGNPRPHTLKGDDLVQARLTRETWRLEIVSDGTTQVEKPCRIDDGTALDLPALEELGRKHGVKFLKAMQCLNIPQPLGQGLWEGVPLRELIKRLGSVRNIRRIYYWGFHNNDSKQLFQSSLSYSQVMDTAPSELPVFVAYRLNGQPLSLTRGGPVRIVVPWAHGFKSIKWLHRIVLTNNFQANDTYADANNDPESSLKTMARIDDGPEVVPAGKALLLSGTALSGLPGLERVEYWLRPDAGTHGRLDESDLAWNTANWKPCKLDAPPMDWNNHLPEGIRPHDLWGFDRQSGKPREWPLHYSVARWTVALENLAAGAYEFRVRTVDRNGFAQPEPRTYSKSGRNEVQCRTFMVQG